MSSRETRSQNHVVTVMCLALLVLSACTSPSDKPPLQIVSVSISPEPVVGQIVTLEVQIMSTKDEADVVFLVNMFEKEISKVHLVSGEAEWNGLLIANEPKTFQLKICVLQEGSWPIEIQSASRLSENKYQYNAVETIHIESTVDSGRLIRNWEYTFSQDEATKRPTPIPVEVSDECAGR